MGLLDGYFDPKQFQARDGLLGRLLSLPQMQGLYQPDADFDPQILQQLPNPDDHLRAGWEHVPASTPSQRLPTA